MSTGTMNPEFTFSFDFFAFRIFFFSTPLTNFHPDAARNPSRSDAFLDAAAIALTRMLE
jgi:hypothetical protein